jgi:phospholipase A1/A2
VKYELRLLIIGLPTILSTTFVQANECVMKHFKSSSGSLTLDEIRVLCEDSVNNELVELDAIQKSVSETGIISERLLKESRSEFDPYVITPHRVNYFLPALTTNAINKDVYNSFDGYEGNLEDIEAKFQLSLKVPMNSESIFIEGDGVYLGFTLQSWWQVYASNISKPFRESNYQPEVFYIAPLTWQPFGGNTGFVLGLEHQSNGRAQNLSRSWNRVYGHFLFEKGDFAMSFKTWHRIEEDEKEEESDSDGDDNPDITDYMGRFELGMVYKWSELEFSVLGRQNFSTHNGAAEFGLTFPLWGKLRGYVSAFSGYGESLIDYNYNQTRFGVGIALNNVL